VGGVGSLVPPAADQGPVHGQAGQPATDEDLAQLVARSAVEVTDDADWAQVTGAHYAGAVGPIAAQKRPADEEASDRRGVDLS
jgi:hypothetical protein